MKHLTFKNARVTKQLQPLMFLVKLGGLILVLGVVLGALLKI